MERDSEHRGYVRYSQSEKECKKLSKGAWGKVKNIIQTRKDSLKRKHRKSGSEADFKNQNEADFSSFEYLEVEDETWSAASSENQTSYNRPGQEDITDFSKQMVSDPTQIKSKHSSSSSNYGGDDNLLDGQQEKSKMKKNKIQNLMIQVAPEDTALPDERAKGLHASPTPGSNALPGGSPNSQRKSKWTKVKNVFLKRDADMDLACQRPQSVPASPTNLTSFSYDDLGLFEGRKHDIHLLLPSPGSKMTKYWQSIFLMKTTQMLRLSDNGKIVGL